MKEIYKRYIENSVDEDLKSKMVFVGGPRQVGKTTFALTFLSEPSEKHPAYLNWDNILFRSALLRGELPPNESIIVLDEIHKFARWRNLVKGFYDARKSEISFIITGSARLDYYSKGGDSLQGRYHYYRLHPFSLREINTDPSQSDVQRLLKYGGFPEPFLMAEEKYWRRWQRERLHRVIYEDIRDLENIKEISLLELLAEELPNRVGAPLSVKKLKERLQVAHETVERWLKIFERMYYCYRIPPYGSPKVRAVKKEQKLYLWDWSIVPDSGPRFENFIASQLLKYCHLMEDTEGFRMDLRFIRDTDKREIDFVVLKDGRPMFAVECKSGEKNINPALFYFMERTPIPKFYQVHEGRKDYEKNGVRVLPVQIFCKELDLP
ncbi:ATP-binding protein [Candidatus Woesebacteria bacterium]|nr:MAG: ATP-binding protein [Candidatus Woesebacteria bacterium]